MQYTFFEDFFKLRVNEGVSEVSEKKSNYEFGNLVLIDKLSKYGFGNLELFNLPYYLVEILDDTMYNAEIRLGNHVVLSFRDRLIVNDKTKMGCSPDLTCFTRMINGKNTKYTFKDNERQLVEVERKLKAIPGKRLDSHFHGKYVAMDLETRVVNGKMMPYCISIFNGESTFAFYLSDFDNEAELIKTSITRLFRAEFDKQNVYIHNFSYFDGILMLTYITDLAANVDIIMRENSIINVKAYFYTTDNAGVQTKRHINFRDSYNLLPSSLRKLAKSFGVSDKGIFPYAFINENNDINYIGPIPDYKYFDKATVTIEEYNEYKTNFKDKLYNIKEETIKYCNQDVVTLHEVIHIFSKYIFDKFNINIHNTPTISSLAFAIFRSNFLDGKLVKIPIILGEMYKELKLSYYGGAVDVYKPYGENLYEYDVNSLYPYVMKEFEMPVGQPIYFEGNLNLVTEFYSDYYSEIENRKNIEEENLYLDRYLEKSKIQDIKKVKNSINESVKLKPNLKNPFVFFYFIKI